MSSENLETFYIPKTLDAPEKILFFTVPDLAFFLVPFIVGLAVNHMLVGLMVGTIGLYVSKKISSTGIYVKRLLYWYTRPNMFFFTRDTKFAPPSTIRILR